MTQVQMLRASLSETSGLLHSHTTKQQQRERTSDVGLTYFATLPHNQTTITGADVRRRTYLLCYTPTQPNDNNGSGRQTKDLLTLLHSHTTKQQQRERTLDERLRTYLLCSIHAKRNDNNGTTTTERQLTEWEQLNDNNGNTTTDTRRMTYCFATFAHNETTTTEWQQRNDNYGMTTTERQLRNDN